MSGSVFVELEFAALVVCSIFLPIGLYGYMMWKEAISRATVFVLGVVLIVTAGVDVFCLQRLADMARHSPSLLDDKLFSSEISLALYLLPALFAGVGVNMISHVLITHLANAELKFDQKKSEAARDEERR